jgi:hypothetical protein
MNDQIPQTKSLDEIAREHLAAIQKEQREVKNATR